MKQFLGGLALAGAIGYGFANDYRSDRDDANRALHGTNETIGHLRDEVRTTRDQLAQVTQDNQYNTYLANGLTARQRTQLNVQYAQEQTALAARTTAETRARENQAGRSEYESCMDNFVHNPTVEEHITGRHHCFYAPSTYTVIYDTATHRLVATR